MGGYWYPPQQEKELQDAAEAAARPQHVPPGAGVGWGFLLKVVGFSLKLYSAVSCVYPDVS